MQTRDGARRGVAVHIACRGGATEDTCWSVANQGARQRGTAQDALRGMAEQGAPQGVMTEAVRIDGRSAA